MSAPLGRIYQGLAGLILFGLLVQFYFAGVGLFGAGPMTYHRALGNLLWLLTVLPVLVALAGRLGRRRIGHAVLLLALMTLQIALPSLRDSASLVAALHPVNALALLAISYVMVRPRASTRSEPSAMSRTPVSHAATGHD